MEGISDIKIVGIDEKRPPVIRKEPYIDLYFKLSHKAPADWCGDFNSLMMKHPCKPKIDKQKGLFIDAWVRTPDDIATLLEILKKNVAQCSDDYIRRIEAALNSQQGEDDSLSQVTAEQGRLNRIIAELDFGDVSLESYSNMTPV